MIEHKSDCAIHNMSAFPLMLCDCGAEQKEEAQMAEPPEDVT